ncbi:hypothetical protein ACJX0J_007174, partial [Zea mays]
EHDVIAQIKDNHISNLLHRFILQSIILTKKLASTSMNTWISFDSNYAIFKSNNMIHWELEKGWKIY